MNTDIQDETELRGTVVCGQRSYVVPLDVKREVERLECESRLLKVCVEGTERAVARIAALEAAVRGLLAYPSGQYSETEGYDEARQRAKALLGGAPAGYRVSIGTLKASNGTSYVVCIDQDSRPRGAAPWDSGRITPFATKIPEHAKAEAKTWATFLGAKVDLTIHEVMGSEPEVPA